MPNVLVRMCNYMMEADKWQNVNELIRFFSELAVAVYV